MGWRSWTKEEDKIVIDGHGKLTCKEMIPLLPNRSREAIEQRSRTLGLSDKRRIRKHSVDMEFFSVPSTLNSYWAGFIAADGCLTKNKHLVSFGIHWDDGYLLEQFIKDSKFGGSVRYFVTGEGSRRAQLQIYGVGPWFKDLWLNFCIKPKKSLTLGAPNLENKDHIKAYVRGLIDGDGSILERTGLQKWRLQLVGTMETLMFVKQNYEQWINSATPAIENHSYEKICRYRVNGKQSLQIISQLLSVKTPYLHRKWDPVMKELGIK